MDETDLNTSMYAQYQMETETAWLVSVSLSVLSSFPAIQSHHREHKNQMTQINQKKVRNAEETLRLIRQMQELWLFGTLDTVGKSDVELKTEEETRRVAGLLEKMIEKQVGADGIGAVDVAGDERSK